MTYAENLISSVKTGPATPKQLRYIALLSSQLKMPEPRVTSFGEAGRMISELKAEKEHRKYTKSVRSK